MSDVHDVAGYALCVDCQDAWVLDVVAARTGNLCVDCLTRDGSPLRHIEIQARGARLPIPVSGRRRRSPKRPKTPEARRRERLVDNCKTKARKRLAAIFPELYDILLAEERAAVGLDPFPVSTAAERPIGDASQTVDFARLYHALDERGVDV